MGAAWNGHNESFVKDLKIFSTLKPRISYAVTGQAMCDYAEYKQSYSTFKVHLYGGPFDNKWTEEMIEQRTKSIADVLYDYKEK